MEEQPQESPTEQPDESSDGKPKIFGNMNTVIAGVTGLLIAIGGLATTWDKIFGGDEPAEQAVAAKSEEAPAAEEPAADTAAEAEDPTYYDIDDGGSLRFIDGLWVENSNNGKFRYEEVSNDGEMIVAVDRGGGDNGEDAWLRWPIAGGRAQESQDKQETWTDVFSVYVPEEA